MRSHGGKIRDGRVGGVVSGAGDDDFLASQIARKIDERAVKRNYAARRLRQGYGYAGVVDYPDGVRAGRVRDAERQRRRQKNVNADQGRRDPLNRRAARPAARRVPDAGKQRIQDRKERRDYTR